MTTPVDRLRTAWKTGGRLALHREAESLASEGTTHAVLDEAINTLLLEARAADAGDDTEEEILGVGDRLSGWCNLDRRITIRNASSTPAANGVPAPTDRPVSPA
ncbi:MAG TPA: hypothetical protein VD866_31530 [Urbifossiella sp.]|nr:hypothetical protein [Urbifossiella sp.]